MIPEDESALVEQARRNPRAFAALYDRYVEIIYGYVMRQVGDVAIAQDITAATFEKALRHIRRYRWREAGLAPWLYTIARNEIAQHFRRGRFTVAWRPDNGDGPDRTYSAGQSDGRPIESMLLATERDSDLHAALRDLSAADRDVLTLRFLEGLPTEDVAATLGCSRDNVYVRLHRALARLRGQLERQDEAKERIK